MSCYRQQGLEGNTLALRIDSGNQQVQDSRWDTAVYIASGWDPYELMEQSVAAAAAWSGGAKPRWEKETPDITNWFGWCTWDAFYHDVSAQGIQHGLKAFAAGGVQPRFLIIDDGWQVRMGG